MILEHLIHFLLNSYLNPLLFLFYFLTVRHPLESLGIYTFRESGINNERLIAHRYLMLAPGIYLSWFLINFLFLRSFNAQLSIDAFLDLDLHWLQYLPFFLTALTLKAYTSKTGMEGNVMGFIFFPMLVVGIAINGLFYFYWIWNTVLVGGLR